MKWFSMEEQEIENSYDEGTKLPQTMLLPQPAQTAPSQAAPAAKAHSNRLKRRFLFVALIMIAAAAYILLRYFAVMVNPPRPALFAQPTIERGERGAILDRNGRVLALQARMGDVSVWRPNIRDINALGYDLSPLLDIPADEIVQTIQNSRSNFLYLQRNVDQAIMARIQQMRSHGMLAGVSVEPVFGRIYPERSLASQIIGFTGDGNIGRAGIEHAFNDDLTGRGGRSGHQVVLTIDTNVQHILENVARSALEEHRADAVMLMAMDPRNGDILGAASLPNFDPNDFRNSTETSRMDRGAIWAFEPGSTFKVFSVAAMLESGAILPTTEFYCDGRYVQGGQVVITCLRPHGRVTAQDMVVLSCNTATAYASDRMGNTAFARAIEAFGFGRRTGAGLPGETVGVFRPLNQWSNRTRPTIAMGQEISVSALQMLQAMTPIANDGILVSPRIVSRIVDEDGRTVREFWPDAPRRVISAETSRQLRSYMHTTTSNMGRFAMVRDVPLGVKTGTAQMIDPLTRTYSTTDFIASTIALLPADNPTLVLYMVIIRPRGDFIWGSRTAAPAIREAAEALIDYLGIARGRSPQVRHSGEIAVPPVHAASIGQTIPDFSGSAMRSLVPLLFRDDLQLEIRGEGWVRRQYPPPGTPFYSGMTLLLELE